MKKIIDNILSLSPNQFVDIIKNHTHSTNGIAMGYHPVSFKITFANE
jgi:hypothetical protein